MQEKTPEIEIRGERSTVVRIALLRREFPECDDYDDANWLNAHIEIAARAWRGKYPANLRTDDLARFHEGLRKLYADLAGTAELDPLEPYLKLVFSADRTGKVTVRGRAREEFVDAPILEFTMELDQTYLPGIVAQLEDVLRRFPVRGQAPR